MLDHAAATGQVTAGHYSQTLISKNFYVVLTLSGPEDDVNLKLGHDTLAKIEEIIAQTPQISSKELLELQVESFKNGIELSILIAKIQTQKLSLAAHGAVAAKLVRKGKLINLLSPSSGTTTLAGPLLEGDLLVLGTTNFFNSVPSNLLVPNDQLLIPDIRDTLLPLIKASDLPDISTLLIRLDLSAKTEADEETPEEEPSPLKESTTTPVPTDHHPSPTPPAPKLAISSLRHRLFLRRPAPQTDTPNPSRTLLYIALILLVTLASLIAWQLRSKTLETRSQKAFALERQINDTLAGTQKLVGLNDALARELLTQAKTDFEAKAIADFGPSWQTEKTPESKRLLKALDNLNSQISQVSHLYPISKLDVFYDFSLLKQGAAIASSELHQGQIIALDKGNGSLYSLSLGNKSAAIITGSDDLKSANYVDFTGTSIYAFTPEKIIQINQTGTPPTSRSIIKKSDKWKKIKSLKTFGGNLYLLDPQGSQIWKYLATDLGFTDIIGYLKTGLSLDLSRVTSFVIDGYIYLLSSSGKILRVSQGSPEDFNLTGLPTEASAKAGLDDSPKKPTAIYASDETQNLYLLTTDPASVLVFDKKGNYQAQYPLPSPNFDLQTTSLLASESLKKVFLVSGNFVYSFNLK